MEANSRKQKEDNKDRKMAEMGLSATEKIQKQVDKSLEPKLEKLLARKVKTNALKTKPNRDHSVDSESTLAKFAQQKFGKELSSSEKKISDSDMDDRKPSGKGFQFKKGTCKPFFDSSFDCYAMDNAPSLRESGHPGQNT
jgi:hypothetical protein